MAAKPRPSTRSSKRKTARRPIPGPFTDEPDRARAHRDDTPEARRQREGLPKTHPTRNPVSARKDKLPRRSGTR